MHFLLTILTAVIASIFQISFLSHLPFPLHDLHLPVVAISLSIAARRPLTAALWAFSAGATLDIHGVFGFGAELGALFAAYAAGQFLFGRLLSSASAPSIMLLAASCALARFLWLAVIDAGRLMSGGVSYLLAESLEALSSAAVSMAACGTAAALSFLLAGAFRRRFQRVFLTARSGYR